MRHHSSEKDFQACFNLATLETMLFKHRLCISWFYVPGLNGLKKFSPPLLWVASHLTIQIYIKFLVNVAKQCTLWERALKIRFRLDLWLSCLLTSDFYRWLWIRSYSFVKKGRENFLYKTETNSFHFFHFDKVESSQVVFNFLWKLGSSLVCTMGPYTNNVSRFLTPLPSPIREHF